MLPIKLWYINKERQHSTFNTTSGDDAVTSGDSVPPLSCCYILCNMIAEFLSLNKSYKKKTYYSKCLEIQKLDIFGQLFPMTQGIREIGLGIRYILSGCYVIVSALPIHCNYQLAHYSGFWRISPSILNRFKPNLQA